MKVTPSTFSTITLKTIAGGTPWEDREPELYSLFVKALTGFNSSDTGKPPRRYLLEKFPKLKKELGEKYEIFAMEFEQCADKEPPASADLRKLEKAVGFNDTDNIIAFLSDFRDNNNFEQ